MCESNAFLKRGDDEELLLAEVSVVEPVEGGFVLRGLFGEEVEVAGTLKVIDLLKHKIIFEPNG